jgi:hypothetical protein
VDFDAASVTVFLEPWLDVGCVEIILGEDMMGFPRVGIARNGAFIEGELRFPGPNEHAPNGWDSLPTPRAGEVRVAYVQTTTACATCRNTAPGGPAGTSDRITEDMQGVRGNPFRIASRASALAVFAIAGIENTQTGQFAPYVMGMRRGVLLGPEQTLSNVELQMNIPLDQPLDIELSGLPAPSSRGPDRFVVRATLDLGGEGFLRPVRAPERARRGGAAQQRGHHPAGGAASAHRAAVRRALLRGRRLGHRIHPRQPLHPRGAQRRAPARWLGQPGGLRGLARGHRPHLRAAACQRTASCAGTSPAPSPTSG